MLHITLVLFQQIPGHVDVSLRAGGLKKIRVLQPAKNMYRCEMSKQKWQLHTPHSHLRTLQVCAVCQTVAWTPGGLELTYGCFFTSQLPPGFWVHVAPEVSRLGVTVIYTGPAAAPEGPCVSPGRRAALLCSSSSSSAWSCRASPDTALAEASRSATVGCKMWGRLFFGLNEVFSRDLYSFRIINHKWKKRGNKRSERSSMGVHSPVFSGPWKTPLCFLSPARPWVGSRAAPCRSSESPTEWLQTPTHRSLWWIYPAEQHRTYHIHLEKVIYSGLYGIL